MRDLSRAREATLHAPTTAQLRLNAILRRPALRSTGRATWGPAHRRWRSAVAGHTPRRASSAKPLSERSPRPLHCASGLTRHSRHQSQPGGLARWLTRSKPAVACRCTGAVTTGAALGDRPRCEPPRPLMRYLGLTPSESSRGERRHPGGLHDREAPCPSGPRRRGLGLSRSGPRESAPATSPGTAPPADQDPRVEGTGPPVHTRSTTCAHGGKTRIQVWWRWPVRGSRVCGPWPTPVPVTASIGGSWSLHRAAPPGGR